MWKANASHAIAQDVIRGYELVGPMSRRCARTTNRSKFLEKSKFRKCRVSPAGAEMGVHQRTIARVNGSEGKEECKREVKVAVT